MCGQLRQNADSDGTRLHLSVDAALAKCASLFEKRANVAGRQRDYSHCFMTPDGLMPLPRTTANATVAESVCRDALSRGNDQSMCKGAALAEHWWGDGSCDYDVCEDCKNRRDRSM